MIFHVCQSDFTFFWWSCWFTVKLKNVRSNKINTNGLQVRWNWLKLMTKLFNKHMCSFISEIPLPVIIFPLCSRTNCLFFSDVAFFLWWIQLRHQVTSKKQLDIGWELSRDARFFSLHDAYIFYYEENSKYCLLPAAFVLINASTRSSSNL